MSTGQLQRTRSTSKSSSLRSGRQVTAPAPAPAPSITPKNDDGQLESCAATAAFFLYAQRNIILCLHHDTLAIERRFDRHREDVLRISADNVSERGSGRMVVSCDVGQTTIVWDLMTGDEIARFASYEEIKVATWMRNGNVVFGNSQGNIILFEPSTSEHISARTIFDPITALAPAADCRTYAIGYQNGSILIATLQPSFTILHTLSTTRAPSPIVTLAWHGSSSKQKSEMLATLTADGDLRVWSIPKIPHGESPCIIRVLNRSDMRMPGPCWFGWSKMGRIVHYSEGQTHVWDVRTKKVTSEAVPTIDGLLAIANYGPTATLFTLGRNHTVQQYDLNPNTTPMLVANVQHVPANAPPSPPNSIEEKREGAKPSAAGQAVFEVSMPIAVEMESSEDEGMAMSPLQKIAQEMDQIEDELRDRVGPLSPSSSRASSVSSHSVSRHRWPSAGMRSRHHDGFKSPATASTASDATTFSYGSSLKSGSMRGGHESVSIRSISSTTSSNSKPSRLRQEILRSPDEAKQTIDLFPFAKARLRELPFRTPRYDDARRTPEDLRRQMLSIVFGWEDDVEALIRDEVSRHAPGSASSVLLSKWLGDLGADLASSMVGSESMTSSDWMLLALSAMGQDSQKKVGEAFVHRLLEKGDIHPAVAILLGLGEQNDAIEVYVSRKYFLEAVLLTCLFFPSDWQRQSHLVRKWGEAAATGKQPEFAVKCFACTIVEPSEPWFSPRSQDAVYTAQMQNAQASQISPPQSPPSAVNPGRKSVSNSGLRLITNFGDKDAPKAHQNTTETYTPMQGVGVTPIVESALSPGGAQGFLRPSSRNTKGRSTRESSIARTATPGGYKGHLFPSMDAELATPADATPIGRDFTPATAIKPSNKENLEKVLSHSRKSSKNSHDLQSVTLSAATYAPAQQLSAAVYQPGSTDNKPHEDLPAPAQEAFTTEKQDSRSRNGSRVRKPTGLHLEMVDNVVIVDGSHSHSGSLGSGYLGRTNELSPPATSSSLQSAKIKNIDNYIHSLEEANFYARQQGAESKQRTASRDGRARSRTGGREEDELRGRSGVRYIKPAKRSPSSPVSMSPEDAALFTNPVSYDDERYYGVTSPIDSTSGSMHSHNNVRGSSKVRSTSKASRRATSPDKRAHIRNDGKPASRTASRPITPEPLVDDGGRSGRTGDVSHAHSSPSPFPLSAQASRTEDEENEIGEAGSDKQRTRSRQRSTSRKPGSRAASARRDPSPDIRRDRERSHSRRPQHDTSGLREVRESSLERTKQQAPKASMPKLQAEGDRSRSLTRKQLAARELEERRLSLARRPSAPVIPHPGELSAGRPPLSARSSTELGNSPVSYLPPLAGSGDRGIARSHTVDPDAMHRYTNPLSTTGTSTSSMPIGLPATPRAMRHPRYMSADPNERDGVPTVPEIPDTLVQLASADGADGIGPLLPATVFGQPAANGPARSMSTPPEKTFGMVAHPSSYKPSVSSSGRRASLTSRGHGRPRSITASIDETIHDSQVIIIEDPYADAAPPMLPELQHLAGPPPPPPPPRMFTGNASTNDLGVINIAIDDQPHTEGLVVEVPSARATPVSIDRVPTGSPSMQRHGRGSAGDNVAHKFRSVRERMRSTSRSRAKSPPIGSSAPPAYESVLPPIQFLGHRSMSPTTDSAANHAYESIPPPPPPPPAPPAGATPIMEVVIPPEQPPSRSGFAGYRNPKEIRANMPPEQIQLGVVPQAEGGMI